MVDTDSTRAARTDTPHAARHDTEHFDCIISGGGPAGIVAGLLLARGGVKVVVLEKHEDFFAISAATPSTRPLCVSSTSWASTIGSPASPTVR